LGSAPAAPNALAYAPPWLRNNEGKDKGLALGPLWPGRLYPAVLPAVAEPGSEGCTL
jgi:hypothetical protein